MCSNTSSCVEVATNWQRSSRCEAASCVEVNNTSTVIYVRDSKNPDGGILEFTAESWHDFIQSIKDGEF